MYTAQNIYDLAIDLIDERLASGAINATTTAVYKARTPGILNLFQNRVYRNGDYFKEVNIPCKPTKNLLGMTAGMDYLEYLGIEKIIVVTGSVKNYYFEANSEGIIYIEDFTTQWNTLATVIVPSGTKEFTPYFNTVIPTTSATMSRIRFTGQYRYIITNYALFDVATSPTNPIIYRPWVKHTMPNDFKSIAQIIDEHCDRQFEKDSSYKFINRKDLYINYFYEGNIKISYKPVPPLLINMTDELVVDEITATSGAYFLAAHFLLIEDPGSASFFNGMFLELEAQANERTPATIQNIVDYQGGGYYF
ncbi:hypothetical protein [Clostridium sp.]